MRRVAITGIGAVSPLGSDAPSTWRELVAGHSGVGPIEHFDAHEYTTRIAAYNAAFDPSVSISPKEARRMSRFIQMAVVAADEAVGDAVLDMTSTDAERVGVIVGSGIGGLMTMEEQHTILTERGPSRVSPFLVPMMIVDLAAGHISIRVGAKGPNFAPVSACATRTHAIGEAAEMIRRGVADVVIAGGFDAGVTPLGVAGFCAARSLSTRNQEPTRASRPFDMGRDGFVIGEGGGIVVLESWEHAAARGARVRAEVVGYGATADAYHITAPAPDGNGARRAMQIALAQSGLGVGAIGYVNAHGTSTELGDAIESAAIRTVFGASAPAVSSTKSMTGHLLGGAGSLEAVICVLALETGLLPPTINLEDPDPACELDHVANVAREAPVEAVMSNSFGFGGHNATLILARADR